MLVIESGELPPLVKTDDCVALDVPTACPLKVRLAGLKVTLDELAIPVPVKPIVCGLPAALSVTAMLPFRVPVVVGVKVTLIVQLAPAASVPPRAPPDQLSNRGAAAWSENA